MRNTAESLFHGEGEKKYSFDYLIETFNGKINTLSGTKSEEVLDDLKDIIYKELEICYDETDLIFFKRLSFMLDKILVEYGSEENLSTFIEIYTKFSDSVDYTFENVLNKSQKEELHESYRLKLLFFWYFSYRYYYMLNYIDFSSRSDFEFVKEDEIDENLKNKIDKIFSNNLEENQENHISDIFHVLYFTLPFLNFTPEQKELLKSLIIKYLNINSLDSLDKKINKFFLEQKNILDKVSKNYNSFGEITHRIFNKNETLLIKKMGKLLDEAYYISVLEKYCDINFFLSDIETLKDIFEKGDYDFLYFIDSNKDLFEKVSSYNLGKIYEFYLKKNSDSGKDFDDSHLEISLCSEYSKFLKKFKKEERLIIGDYLSFDFIIENENNLIKLGKNILTFLDNGWSLFLQENINNYEQLNSVLNTYKKFFTYLSSREDLLSYIDENSINENQELKTYKDFLFNYISKKEDLTFSEINYFFECKENLLEQLSIKEQSILEILNLRKAVAIECNSNNYSFDLSKLIYISSKFNIDSKDLYLYFFSLDYGNYIFLKKIIDKLYNENNSISINKNHINKIDNLLGFYNFFENIDYYDFREFHTFDDLYNSVYKQENLDTYFSYIDCILSEYMDIDDIYSKIGNDYKLTLEFYNFIKNLNYEGIDKNIEKTGGEYWLFLDYLLSSDNKTDLKKLFIGLNSIIDLFKTLNLKFLLEYLVSFYWFEGSNKNIYLEIKKSDLNIDNLYLIYNELLNISSFEPILKYPFEFIYELVDFINTGKYGEVLNDIKNESKYVEVLKEENHNLSFSFLKEILPSRDSERIIGFFEDQGFEAIRQNSTNHRIFKAPNSGRHICIPTGKNDIPLPTLKGIIQSVYFTDIK